MTGARREDESVLMHGWSIRHLCKSIQCVFASNAVVWWCFPSYPHNESIFNGINNKKKRKESEKKENEETNCQSLQIAVHVRSRHPRMAYTCGHYEWFTTALEWMSRQCATQHKMMIDRAQHFKTSLHADFFSFFFSFANLPRRTHIPQFHDHSHQSFATRCTNIVLWCARCILGPSTKYMYSYYVHASSENLGYGNK